MIFGDIGGSSKPNASVHVSGNIAVENQEFILNLIKQHQQKFYAELKVTKRLNRDINLLAITWNMARSV